MIEQYTIDRPEAHNAINAQVMDELEHAVHRASDPAIKVFILTGSGQRYFASGGDLREFSLLKSAEQGSEMSQRMHTILTKLEQLKAITIACVNGDAYGGGCELLGAFDLVLASDKARFGFTQKTFYLPPGWGGITRLQKRVGRRLLMWLAAGSVISAADAHLSGLVDSLFTHEKFALEYHKLADSICETDDLLLHALKSGFSHAEKFDKETSIQMEREAFAAFWGHDEHHARVENFLKRR